MSIIAIIMQTRISKRFKVHILDTKLSLSLWHVAIIAEVAVIAENMEF